MSAEHEHQCQWQQRVTDLLAEVERLREHYEPTEWQKALRTEREDFQVTTAAFIDRVAAAEQERDRLREGIAALAAEAQVFLSTRDMTWEMRHFVEKVRALLPGSGEQPGECLSDPAATVADGWCNHPGFRHRYGTPRPAPVVPDGMGLRHENVLLTDAMRYYADRRSMDNPKGWDHVSRVLETAIRNRVYDGVPPEQIEEARAVLAVVGQNVAADAAPGVTAGEGWVVTAHFPHDHYRVTRTEGGWDLLTRDDRAVVGSDEQGERTDG